VVDEQEHATPSHPPPCFCVNFYFFKSGASPVGRSVGRSNLLSFLKTHKNLFKKKYKKNNKWSDDIQASERLGFEILHRFDRPTDRPTGDVLNAGRSNKSIPVNRSRGCHTVRTALALGTSVSLSTSARPCASVRQLSRPARQTSGPGTSHCRPRSSPAYPVGTVARVNSYDST
jgi:hypothetical protein